ncbi:MAG: hypothetical protein AAF481_17215 [Acidobacteriota bacterium]
MRRISLLVSGLTLAVLFSVGPAAAKTITVNSPLDNNVTNDGDCTLREAVQSAQNDNMNQPNQDCAWGQGPDEIVFSSAVGSAVTLNTQVHLSSDLVIRGPMTIKSAGFERLFRIGGKFNIEFRDLALEDGNESGAGGAILIASPAAQVDIVNCRFRGNVAEGLGGAISSANAKVTIKDSEFAVNKSASSGGALHGSNMSISNSSFESNMADLGGGALFCASGSSSQPVLIERTYFATNIAWGKVSNGIQTGGGGAIMSNCYLEVLNSEFQANMAFGVVGGGALLHGSAGVATITRSLFQVNSAGWGDEPSGGSGGAILARGELHLHRSVLTDNVARGGNGGGGVYFENSQGSYVVNSAFMWNISQFDQMHALRVRPQMPRSGGAIGIYGTSEVELIHTSLVGNYGRSEINYEIVNSPGHVYLKNSLVEGHFTDSTCDGNGLPLMLGGETISSGGNLQLSPTAATCPEVPETKTFSKVFQGDFNLSTPAGLLTFEYPVPDPAGPAVGGAVGSFCTAAGVWAIDLLNLPRTQPCDIGAVEVPIP